jgi:hypothetical protein
VRASQIGRVEIAAGGALCFFLVQSKRQLLTAPKRKKAGFIRVHRLARVSAIANGSGNGAPESAEMSQHALLIW